MDESPSKKKWISSFWVSLTVLALLAGSLLFLSSKLHQIPPPSITLSNGSKITVVAVTFGTNHVIGGWLSRMVDHSPAIMRGLLSDVLGQFARPAQSFNTPSPTLVVWLDSTGWLSSPNEFFESAFGDTNGFVSGVRNNLYLFPGGLKTPLQFSAFPRRDHTLALHVFRHDQKNQITECGVLTMANPVYGRFPKWQPETLAVTRRAGDVEATLQEFSTGYGWNMSTAYRPDGSYTINLGTNKNDGRNGSACVLHLRSLSDTNQIWELNKVELGDATGNMIRATSTSRTGGQNDFLSFDPSLWPGETTWKLRCGLECVKGFSRNELIVITNVSLGELFQTNHPAWKTNLDGVTIGFDQLIHRAPYTNDSWTASQFSMAAFTFSGMTNDQHFELIEARADDGTKLESPSSSSTSDVNGIEIMKSYSFRNVSLGTKTLNFTVALKNGRWVEFMVKPRIGSGHFEFPAQPHPEIAK